MKQTDRAASLLHAVMEQVEAVAKLHVETETDDMIMPQPLAGQSVLDQLRAGSAQRNAIEGIDRKSYPRRQHHRRRDEA